MHRSFARSAPARLAVLALAAGTLVVAGAGAATVFELCRSSAHADPGRRGSQAQTPTRPPPALAQQAQAQQAQPTPPSPAAGSALAVASQLGDAFADVASHLSPSVVNIRVEVQRPRQEMPFQFGPFGPQFGPGDGGFARGEGSGVIISADGAILTNNHVIENATRIDVRLRDGRTLRGSVVGSDPATDLAVIRIAERGLPAAHFADSDGARPGEWVVAVGSPFGLEYTVTAGVLSAVGRGGLGQNEIEDYLQTDASINPGNSGGPLVNLHGEVLGINSMIIGRGTGIGFAIPSNLARSVAEQLIASGTVRRAWLGIGFQPLTPELASSLGAPARHGALVNQIVPNGPAARAGLRIGDIVTTVDGRAIDEGNDLLRQVIRQRVGARLALGVVRDGRPQSLDVTTAARPDEHSAQGPSRPTGRQLRQHGPDFGLQLQSLTPLMRQQMSYTGTGSVVVVGVEEGSAADRAGLRPGDVVVEADRQPVTRSDQVNGAMRDGAALLRIERHDASVFTILQRD